MPFNCHLTLADVSFVFMGKVIPFPMARVRRRPRRRVDVFSRHFELLQRVVLWDRLAIAAIAFVTLCAVV